MELFAERQVRGYRSGATLVPLRVQEVFVINIIYVTREALVMIFAIRDTISVLLSLFTADWIERRWMRYPCVW